jgi:hypothetical protein
MQLLKVQLLTGPLAEQKEFYVEKLGLPLVASSAQSFSVQAGGSQLAFAEAAKGELLQDTLVEPTHQTNCRIVLIGSECLDYFVELFPGKLKQYAFPPYQLPILNLPRFRGCGSNRL